MAVSATRRLHQHCLSFARPAIFVGVRRVETVYLTVQTCTGNRSKRSNNDQYDYKGKGKKGIRRPPRNGSQLTTRGGGTEARAPRTAPGTQPRPSGPRTSRSNGPPPRRVCQQCNSSRSPTRRWGKDRQPYFYGHSCSRPTSGLRERQGVMPSYCSKVIIIKEG